MDLTIEDIARRVGRSKMTVSQALRGVGRVGEETRRHILRTAEQMGYRPNSAARAISTGRFGCAALLLGTLEHRSTLADLMLRGIHDALAERTMHLAIAILPDEKLTNEGFVPTILQQWTADGLLINYTDHIPERMIELIRGNGLPSIWMNSLFNFDCIRPDDVAAGRQATEHLLGLGHKHIAYVDFSHATAGMDQAHYSARERQAGYEQAMRVADLPIDVVRPESTEVPRPDRVEFAKTWLRRANRATAAVIYGSTTTIPVIVAATALGISVPNHLSLIDFAGAPLRTIGPLLTTMLTPEYEIGRQAVEMLSRKMFDPSVRLPSRTVSFGFEAGATCVPPAE